MKTSREAVTGSAAMGDPPRISLKPSVSASQKESTVSPFKTTPPLPARTPLAERKPCFITRHDGLTRCASQLGRGQCSRSAVLPGMHAAPDAPEAFR